MDTAFKETILAIVTTEKERVIHSSAPVFYACNEEEKERVAMMLAGITLGMVHDLSNGCLIIMRH